MKERVIISCLLETWLRQGRSRSRRHAIWRGIHRGHGFASPLGSPSVKRREDMKHLLAIVAALALLSPFATAQEATFIPEGEQSKVFLVARIWVSIYAVTIVAAVAMQSILPLMIGIFTIIMDSDTMSVKHWHKSFY